MEISKRIVVAALAAWGYSAVGLAFVTPDGSTAPFEDWSRFDANSTYAQWDAFTDAYNGDEGTPDDQGPDNVADVGSFGPAGELVEQTVFGAFLTSGGNIYSFATVNEFIFTQPGLGLGAGNNTRVVMQTNTLGRLPDFSELALTYNDGSTDVTLAPDYITQAIGGSGSPFGGFASDVLAVWDIDGFNPATSRIDFVADGTSLSLSELAIDTYTQAAPLTTLPAQPLPGDTTLNGELTAADIDELYDNLGRVGDFYDFDGDGGGADQDDVLAMLSTAFGTTLGDANLDGMVDSSDFSILTTNFGDAGGWADGDFSGDGLIGSADFSAIAANFGFGTGSSTAVPEPGALAIVASSLALLASARRGSRC